MKNCHKKHELIVIATIPEGFEIYAVVRWCTNCGAIVVDTDHDGRTSPGDRMKMRYSAIGREVLTELNKTDTKARENV